MRIIPNPIRNPDEQHIKSLDCKSIHNLMGHLEVKRFLSRFAP